MPTEPHRHLFFFLMEMNILNPLFVFHPGDFDTQRQSIKVKFKKFEIYFSFEKQNKKNLVGERFFERKNGKRKRKNWDTVIRI